MKIFMIVLAAFFVVILIWAFARESKCSDACYPDIVDRDSCYDDRAVCVGKDKIYVKSIK